MASGTIIKDKQSKLIKKLSCPKCEQLMTDPRVIPCSNAHRVCFNCVSSLGTTFKCPKDSEDVTLSEGGVAELKKDMAWSVSATQLSDMLAKQVKEAGISFVQPAEWDTMATFSGPKVTELDPSSEEYRKLETDFRNDFTGNYKGAVFNQIISIKRIQNMHQHLQYEAKKLIMKKRCDQAGAILERRLWHGTSGDVITEINKTGFNRNFKGKNATRFGQGVYFSTSTAYSSGYARPDSNGHRHMYQARVLTGEYCLGEHKMLVPPKNPANPDTSFDSVVNDVSNPIMFVIFYDGQACPDYLVTFT